MRRSDESGDGASGWSDSRHFPSLVKVFLITDLRATSFGRSTASNHKSAVSPMFWVIGQNLLVGMIASLVMYARVDVFFFVAVHLSLSMILTATTLLAEFNEVVIAPDDLDIIGPLPVKARTYALARLANLFIYLFVVIVSLNLFPAIIGCGLRDADWTYFLLYSFAATTSSMIVAALVILFCLVQRATRLGQAFQDMMAWAQAAAIFVLFYGGQLMLRDGQQGLQWFAYQLPDWFVWTPGAWMAAVVDSSRGVIPVRGMAIGGFALAAMVILWLTVLTRLIKRYSSCEFGGSLLSARVRPLQAPGKLLGLAEGRLAGPSPMSQSAFWFTKTIFARDTNLKMRCWSSFNVVIALVACSWLTSKLDDPMTGFRASTIPSAMAIYLIASPIPAFFHNLRFSNQYRSNWVFEIAPVEDFEQVVLGVRRVVLLRFFVPLWIATVIVLSLAWRDPVHAIFQAAAGWCVVLICSYVCAVIQVQRWPAGEPMIRGESLGPILPLLSAVTVALGFFAAVHLAVASNPLFFGIYLAVLIGLVVITPKLMRRLEIVRSGQRDGSKGATE